jgi:FolB domain-containing protein
MTDPTEQMPTDEIRISDLRFRCVVGVNESERREKQDIVVQLALCVDLQKAGQTDDIADTVDYKSLKKDILVMAEKSQFRLIESLAQSIADICLTYKMVRRVTVVVEKPGALRFARTVGVRIVRDADCGHDQ